MLHWKRLQVPWKNMEELGEEVNREPQGQGMVPLTPSLTLQRPTTLRLRTPSASSYGSSAPPLLSPSSLHLPWAIHKPSWHKHMRVYTHMLSMETLTWNTGFWNTCVSCLHLCPHAEHVCVCMYVLVSAVFVCVCVCVCVCVSGPGQTQRWRWQERRCQATIRGGTRLSQSKGVWSPYLWSDPVQDGNEERTDSDNSGLWLQKSAIRPNTKTSPPFLPCCAC